MKKISLLINALVAVLFLAVTLTRCTKEGPAGLDGLAGKDGTNGKDANETCKQCHNSSTVVTKDLEFENAFHNSELAIEEGASAGCAPCHLHNGFNYVVKNKTASTFSTYKDANGLDKYRLDYQVFDASALLAQKINCYTCHSSLHTSYTSADWLPLATTAPVAMTMWGGAKTIDLAKKNSNLCVKCHQPSPLGTSTTTSTGNRVNYDDLVANPTTVFYNNTSTQNPVTPSYSTHVHYGTVGAIYAGVGAIQFAGSMSYSNSPHTTLADCADCHMAKPTNGTGGHSFKVTNNFNGCNISGCHSVNPLDSTHAKYAGIRSEVKTLINNLGKKLDEQLSKDGISILHTDKTAENRWASSSDAGYTGYLNIYDPSTNPNGAWKNPGSTSSWTADQKTANNSKPVFPTLRNVHMGALLNLQMAVREASLGIHNTNYSKALLTNTIESLTANGTSGTK